MKRVVFSTNESIWRSLSMLNQTGEVRLKGNPSLENAKWRDHPATLRE
jgi:hypothetical protein